MTTVTVHRISLQFDTHDKGAPKKVVERALEEFTNVLQAAFPHRKPQLILDSEEFDAERDVTIDNYLP